MWRKEYTLWIHTDLGLSPRSLLIISLSMSNLLNLPYDFFSHLYNDDHNTYFSGLLE